MADNTLDLSQSLDTVRKLLKIVDNGDDTFSIATSVVSGAATLEVNLDNANDDVLVYGNDGSTNRALKTDAGGELQIDVLSSALPSGAATSTNQSTELTLLQGMSPISAVVFDTILITYSDATKATISKIEWKLGAVVVKTHTPTFATLTDTWVRS